MSSIHARPRTVIGLRATLLAALAVALLGLAVPAPAQAASVHTWSTTTVCVESQVGPEWGVRRAVRTWNELDGPRFVLQDSCQDQDHTVTVGYLGADSRYTGWTTWYWDETGHLVHADVTVNPQRIRAFATEDRACQRQHTMTHELGHALGLRHYPHSRAGSVMSYLGWTRLCGGLSGHDRADLAQLYPAPQAEQAPVA